MKAFPATALCHLGPRLKTAALGIGVSNQLIFGRFDAIEHLPHREKRGEYGS
jgi:hypothetical protein